MRWIQKQSEPRSLTEWRARYGGDINFGYDLLRSDHDVIEEVLTALLAEQGWLCAYTGRRIEDGTCHIEHVKSQRHCTPHEKVSYGNMVACYPGPNPTHRTPYGAEFKGDWPAPAEHRLFVSPLDRTCDTRFVFSLRGEIRSKQPNDDAAKTTIEKLCLDHDDLTRFRHAAIQGTLGRTNGLPIKEARKRLQTLERQSAGRLEPFCFVLVQALEKHIKRLEGIAQSMAEAKKKKHP